MALTREQLIERRRFLGGTDMAALAGVSRWATPLDVYLDKVAEGEPEQRSSTLMEMGNLLEPVIATLFTQRTGIKLWRLQRTLICRQQPWLGAHIDRWAPGLVFEAKYTAAPGDEWGEQGTDVVPPGYRVQLQHYLMVTGRPMGYLAMLTGRGEFRWYAIAHDPELEAALRELGERFWHEHVLPGVPPPPDGSQSYGRWLSQRWQSEVPSADATPKQFVLASQLEAAQQQLLVFQKEVALLQQKLQATMGETARLILPGDRAINWRTQQRATTAWKAVAQHIQGGDVPADIVAAHTTTTTVRPFRVPWPTTNSRETDDD